MLPTGEVVPLSHFFTPSLSAKDVIKDMIEHEAEPLTDEQIAEGLAEKGITVARRTVAKYREQLGHPALHPALTGALPGGLGRGLPPGA